LGTAGELAQRRSCVVGGQAVERLDRELQLHERQLGRLERRPARPAHRGLREAQRVVDLDQCKAGQRGFAPGSRSGLPVWSKEWFA
jgi:hypothetical protein